jgi:hypothetical protein
MRGRRLYGGFFMQCLLVGLACLAVPELSFATAQSLQERAFEEWKSDLQGPAEVGSNVGLGWLVPEACEATGLYSRETADSRTAQAVGRPEAAEEKGQGPPQGGPAAQEEGKPARPKKIRHPDATPEKRFPREVILKNLTKQFAIDEETIKARLTKIEEEMPTREAVMLFVLANDMTRKQILLGEIEPPQRKAAFEKNLQTVLELSENGAGWGDIGRLAGMELSGRDLTMRANKLIGQSE